MGQGIPREVKGNLGVGGVWDHQGFKGTCGDFGEASCEGVTPGAPPPGPPGTLLVSTRHQVLALGGSEPQILKGPLKHVAALDVGIEGGSLFWGDPSEGLIYR